MKKLTCLAAAMTALVATPAMAQLGEDVTITGLSDAFCTLPDTWVVSSSTPSSGPYSGGVWAIPPAALANNQAIAVGSGEVAIRLRGEGSCNTSHTITLTSARGGLRADTAAPAGFADRVQLKYDAFWSTATALMGGGGGTFGVGISNWRPDTPGQTRSQDYIVTPSRAAPANRYFDLRIGLERSPQAGPMVAGDYEDIITVTLTPIT